MNEQIGCFRQARHPHTGEVLHVFLQGPQTKFISDRSGPAPEEGQVWLFQPGKQIFEDSSGRSIFLANLVRPIAPQPEITRVYTPSPNRNGEWQSIEHNGGWSIAYVPDRASRYFPSDHITRFRGQINRLAFYDAGKRWMIVTGLLTEPAPTPTQLRHQNNPARAKRHQEIAAERERQVKAANERRRFQDLSRAERGKSKKPDKKLQLVRA